MLLRGKNAVITGCSRGIGLEILQTFASNGANVWACCRTESEDLKTLLQSVAERFNIKITPLFFDISDEANLKRSVNTIVAENASVDILVNNAGITLNSLFQMTSIQKIRELLEINYVGPIRLTQYIAKIMVKQRSGSIINISSSAALDANPGRSAYGASKAALTCMSRAIAHELAEHRVRVNAIAPGIADTDMVHRNMSEKAINSVIQNVSLKRLGTPSEIASVALFLASDLSSYITGEVIRVDGGLRN